MDVNVLNDHLHQLCLLIDCMLCGGCVSSDEGCLSPRAPTGADVSFFSTLGCSLRGALTSGSMALALLSPFIWSERALAPVPVCRWPSFHLASSLSLSSPDSWLPQPAADRRQVLGLHKCMHALHKHTHTPPWRVAVMHLDADATHPHFVLFFCFFYFLLSLMLPPRLLLHPILPVCLCRSHSLSGVFSLFLWSLESRKSRSSSWRGTSCGPEWLRRQLTPMIQHLTTPAAAPACWTHGETPTQPYVWGQDRTRTHVSAFCLFIRMNRYDIKQVSSEYKIKFSTSGMWSQTRSNCFYCNIKTVYYSGTTSAPKYPH